MSDMMKMYAMNGMPTGMDDYAKEGETLVLNANHPLVQYVLNHQSGSNTKMICEQLYDLAELQNAPLSPDAMSKFVVRTNDIMVMLAKDTKAETTDDATDDQKKEQQ
jgi:molecular chaperone HtpG